MKIRFGIAGLGFGRAVLLPAFQADERFDICAVAASTRERAERVAREHSIDSAFGGWRSMIEDAALDAVAIALPPCEQSEAAKSAMCGGRHVFCVKPIAESVAAASELAALAASTHVANVVDFMFPEIVGWQQAKAILGAGEIGCVRHVDVSWNVETYSVRHNIVSWKTDPAAGGGALGNFASHSLYYLEWLFGSIRNLSCRLSSDAKERYVAMHVGFESGAAGIISISTDAVTGSGHRVEIYGERGTIRLQNTSADYVRGFTLSVGTRETASLRQITVGPDAAHSSVDWRVSPVARLVRRFGDWIENRTPAAPTLEHGFRVQCLLDAARRSAVDGMVIDVPTGVRR